MASRKRVAALQNSNIQWLIGAVQKIAETQGVELDPVPTIRIQQTRPPLGEENAAMTTAGESEEEEVTPTTIDTRDGVDDKEATTAGRALQQRKARKKG